MIRRIAPVIATALICAAVRGASAKDIVCATSNGSAAPFCIESGAMAALDGKDKAPFTFVRHVATCAGRLVVANTSEVAYREGGGGWTRPPRHGKSVMQALGCDTRGAIFIGHKDGIARFEGGQWTDTPNSAVDVTNGILDGVKRFITKPDGSLWAVLGRSLARYHAGEWTRVAELPSMPNEHVRFSDATVDKDGHLWMAHSGGLAVHDGKGWTAHKENLSAPAGIAVDDTGAAWIAVNDGIRIFSDGTWKKAVIGGMEPQIRTRDLAFDASGRLWLATSWGLGVAEKSVARFWRLANSDIPFDDMRTLIVAGKGPSALPPMQDKPTGGIKGRLEGENNTGLEDVRIEFCNIRLSRFTTFRAGDTPCSTQAPLTLTTRTAKDGSFSADRVPPGDYSIVVEREAGKWVLITGSIGIAAEFVRVTTGKVTSIPTITLKAK